jgi:glyoxylase I family protein
MSAFRFTHLDHCTVLITDVAKARQFYDGVLGLREVPAPKEFDFVALWYDLGGQYLHLLLKDRPDTLSPRHFCLHVTDVRAAREHLQTLGVPVEEATKIAAADRFFVRDTDGNRIEVLHWDRPYRPEVDGQFSA